MYRFGVSLQTKDGPEAFKQQKKPGIFGVLIILRKQSCLFSF